MTARGLPAGSTAGPDNFVLDSFDIGLTCPQGAREAFRGVALKRSFLIIYVIKKYFTYSSLWAAYNICSTLGGGSAYWLPIK